jgi:hypothetical protein
MTTRRVIRKRWTMNCRYKARKREMMSMTSWKKGGRPGGR